MHMHTNRVSTSCMADTLDLVGLSMGGEGRKRIVIFKYLIKRHSLDPQVIKTGDPLQYRLSNSKFKLWSSKLVDGSGDGGFERWGRRAFSYVPRWIHRERTSKFLGDAFADTYFTLYMGWILMYNVLARVHQWIELWCFWKGGG